MDHLARGSMKNAANCASTCELQDTWTSTIRTHIAVLGYCSWTTPGWGSFLFIRLSGLPRIRTWYTAGLIGGSRNVSHVVRLFKYSIVPDSTSLMTIGANAIDFQCQTLFSLWSSGFGCNLRILTQRSSAYTLDQVRRVHDDYVESRRVAWFSTAAEDALCWVLMHSWGVPIAHSVQSHSIWHETSRYMHNLFANLFYATSEQVRLPAEFKHINKRRKRN